MSWLTDEKKEIDSLKGEDLQRKIALLLTMIYEETKKLARPS